MGIGLVKNRLANIYKPVPGIRKIKEFISFPDLFYVLP